MKDFEYFIENKTRYEEAIPQMRVRIKRAIESKSDIRQTVALCIELGRLNGVLQCLNTYRKYFRQCVKTALIIGLIGGSIIGYLTGVALSG